MFNTAVWIDNVDPVLKRPLTWAECLVLEGMFKDYVNSQVGYYPTIIRWLLNYIIKPLVAAGWVARPFEKYPEVVVLTDMGKAHIDTYYKDTLGSYV